MECITHGTEKISTSWSDNLNVCGSLEKNLVRWHGTIKADVKEILLGVLWSYLFWLRSLTSDRVSRKLLQTITFGFQKRWEIFD